MKEEDKLKEVIFKNRKDFDSQVPPPAVWEAIKTKIPGLEDDQEEEEPRAGGRKRGAQVWWAAASILFFAGLSFWFMANHEKPSDPDTYPQVTRQQESRMPEVIEMEKSENPIGSSIPQAEIPAGYVETAAVTPAVYIDEAQEDPQAELAGIFVLLHDSLSASNRLEAVLRLAELPNWSTEELAQIHQVLHQDPNTNVRLAALDALARHMPQENAAGQIQELFLLQDDPSIQFELLVAMLLAPDLELEEATSDQLFALAENPLTLDFVKEQAYAVLMKIN